jgi:hypothetical protein
MTKDAEHEEPLHQFTPLPEFTRSADAEQDRAWRARMMRDRRCPMCGGPLTELGNACLNGEPGKGHYGQSFDAFGNLVEGPASADMSEPDPGGFTYLLHLQPPRQGE